MVKIYKLEKYEKGVLVDEQYSFFKQLLIFHMGDNIKRYSFFSKRKNMFVLKEFEVPVTIPEIPLNDVNKMNKYFVNELNREYYS